ncbi:MAG: hypothetical protein KDD29_08610, partial [Flavobacteriales bacterium]|nr:hypothetical protein [Flavobacteriales bacterium]
MKNYISLLGFLLLSFALKAQTWEIIASDEDYKIEKQHIVCRSNQGFEYDYIVLRFTNLTSQNVSLSFNFEEWYNDVCKSCQEGTDESRIRSVQLAPNEVLEGDCNSRGL